MSFPGMASLFYSDMGFDIAKISTNLLDIVYAVDHPQKQSEIYRVRFNTSGQVIGQGNRINDTRAKSQILPRVVSMTEGSTIVGWTTFHNNNTKPDLNAKLFDRDGISY